MLRIPRNILIQQTTRILNCPRLLSTDPTAGSINAAHDKFAEREQAFENAYFRKQDEELFKKLRRQYDSLEMKSNEIEREQKWIEEEIQQLEKQREKLMKVSFKAVRQ
ncbi:unnamed protein product [Rotaria magnacalcarata]|uniref:Uncharacterized protein n=1 Tax=Rotaria magnacalcarata TaxID=392030 RepID=A0A816SE91_9BILA|nr:unnamed protein product [Rotaria magnacalcarata]CAF2085374.1 unnamed protein product [Rotaria magnacalcarata]CAF4036291.1 unnamed protein product [Rotaria magnacalcarata]CAF4908964.1 unnamed protein product [Rotaria magnacalcarata]CAF5142687.1 unnamed protein product [Rotaria magnacalcarata]